MTMSKEEKETIERFLSYTIMFELFKMGWDMAVEYYKAMEEDEFGSYIEPGMTAEEAFSKKLKEMDGKMQITFNDDDGELQ